MSNRPMTRISAGSVKKAIISRIRKMGMSAWKSPYIVRQRTLQIWFRVLVIVIQDSMATPATLIPLAIAALMMKIH